MSHPHLENQYHGVLPQWQVAAAVAIAQELAIRPDDIPDALQEVASELLRFTYDPAKGALEATAVRRVIRNTLINIRRGQIRQARNTEAYRAAQPEAATDDDGQAAVDLWDAVGALDPQEQTICRHLAAGMSIRQIAQTMGMTWHLVDRAVARIRDRLRAGGFEGSAHG